jgi:ankyrin repeat protein
MTKKGGKPLSKAARYGYKTIVELLLATGVDPDPKDNDGRMPLSYAASNGYEAVVEFLI